jgi:hypothetical protein
MRIIISIIIAVLIFCSFCCYVEPDVEDRHGPRVLQPYNPEKAGAEISAFYDLTNIIDFPDDISLFPLFYTLYDHDMVTAPYDLAEYNSKIYIHIAGTIYIFDKQTFDKEDEIAVIFPDLHNIGFGPQGGLVVTGGEALLLCSEGSQIFTGCLFCVNLSTGNAVLLDTGEMLGLDFTQYVLMGYSKTSELIWFRVEGWHDTSVNFHFFRYDEDAHVLTAVEVKNAPKYLGEYAFGTYVQGSDIYGNDVWYSFFNAFLQQRLIYEVGIEKRSIDNPSESLHLIDVEYLGTLTTPHGIIYDEPYIYIMVERNNQIQMLKLLPHG